MASSKTVYGIDQGYKYHMDQFDLTSEKWAFSSPVVVFFNVS